VRVSDIKPVALVTGASSGIGRAAAVHLAAAGFDVAVNYSASEAKALETIRLCEEKGAKTLLFRADVSDDDAVKRMLAAVEATFGRLDALANNAGITSEVGPKDFDAMTAEEWDRVFAVNVRGLFQVTRASIPLLKAARGSIVNTASIVGLRPACSRCRMRRAKPPS
jgi:3-oxoacyl-[acyl-carrier protein] reductase